jgi:hypothetical protein
MKKPTLKPTRVLLKWLSGEFILENLDVPNGGAVVFLRSVLVTLIVFFVSLLAMNLVDQLRTSGGTTKDTQAPWHWKEQVVLNVESPPNRCSGHAKSVTPLAEQGPRHFCHAADLS